MTSESWKSVIQYMQKLYAPIFVITGGEPLVRKDLFEITEFLKQMSAKWGLVTNGFALTQDKMDLLCNHGLSSITISLDGTEKEHLYIRRNPDSFRKVLNSMSLIGKTDLEYKDAVTCVFPGNLDKLHNTAKILLDHGMNSWRLFRIFPKGQALENKELVLDFMQSNALVEWIAENRKEYKKKGLNISFSCEGYLPWKQDKKVRQEPFFCRSGISIASILSDGTVTGCNNNGSEYYQGNIAQDDFKHLWDNRFQEYRDPSWRKTGKCLHCDEWKYCLGNSVHLREKSKDGPGFCYLYNDIRL